MRLQFLEVTNVRNLQSVKLSLHPNTNFIIGPNGSGKTSFLEAISLLSNGRSFRSPDAKKLIRQSSSNLVVFASGSSEQFGNLKIGLSKDSKGNTLAKLNGEPQNRVSSLAKVLPVVILETNSLDLIEGGPAVRRSMLDWGMFHVEHQFLDTWVQYRSALKQKNALLKSNMRSSHTELKHWNAVIAKLGGILDQERSHYTTQLESVFRDVVSHYFFSEATLTFKYRPGWDKENYSSLAECLDAKMDTEIQRSGCLYGPHRAEYDINWGSSLAKDICSRGQKKLVLYGVRLAQIALMIQRTGVSPILLLDDLPAELDEINISNVIRFLKEFPCQTLITAINDQSITQEMLSAFEDHKMFHVEHGTFVETL